MLSSITPSTTMSDLMRERIDAASSFLLQSPPGEINDVVTDLRAIVSVPDDDRDVRLEHYLLPALKKYNCEQYIVATLDRGADSGRVSAKVVVTPVSRLGDSTASSVPATDGREHLERHVDYRREVTFSFDHLNSVRASDLSPRLLTFADSFSTSRDRLHRIPSRFLARLSSTTRRSRLCATSIPCSRSTSRTITSTASRPSIRSTTQGTRHQNPPNPNRFEKRRTKSLAV